MRIVPQIQRGHHFAISRRADDKVNVRGPIPVALLRANHVAHRTIHRDHVPERSNRTQVVASIGVCMEVATQIHFGRIVLLQIVVAGFIRLPNLHRCIRDALPRFVRNSTVEDHFKPVARLGHDGIAQLHRGRIRAIERTHQAALGAGLGRTLVMKRVDQRAHPQRVGE